MARLVCSAVLSAKQMGAEQIIAMSRHAPRQKLAREFGATDIITERGDEGVERVMELTKGLGADSVLECVGTQESMMQAIRSAGLAVRSATSAFRTPLHSTALNCSIDTCICTVGLHRFAATFPNLFVQTGSINPGKVFDLELPLEQVAEGYRAMDERRAIKTLLRT